jgi:hypothetical protein
MNDAPETGDGSLYGRIEFFVTVTKALGASALFMSEWETVEYIRDAHYIDKKSSLMVLGLAVSEEPGMQWLVSWLQPKVSGIKITHIASPSPFMFM